MTKNSLKILFIVGLMAILLFPTTSRAEPAVIAYAKITGCNDPGISGTAELQEKPSEEGVKQVDVALTINGLSDGDHAVHIHETANCTPCGDAGGHFDPGSHGMSSPDENHPFHAGDLINLKSLDGRAVLKTTTTRITLSPGPLSLFDKDGSAFIIHTNNDTYCPDGVIKGCAGGSRDACGKIMIKKPTN